MASLKALSQNKSFLTKIIVAAVVVAALWFGYNKFFKKTVAAPKYQTAKVTRGSIISAVSASGQVTAANSAQVTTQASGTITKIFAKDGDHVASGAPIAQLELDQEALQNYMQALSSYQSSKNNLVSAQIAANSLKSAKIAADDAFKAAKVDKGSAKYQQIVQDTKAADDKYANQENVIAQSKTSLSASWYSLQQSSSVIYAPMVGTVTGLSLQVGSVISSQKNSSNITVSSKIANVITGASPIVSIDLTEIDITKVKIGDKATVTFDALPDKTFTGKVLSIDTTGSVSSGVTTYPTYIVLDVAAPEILSNMSTSANIIVDTKDNILMVPSSAVQNSNGQPTVRVMKNNQIQSVDVETGISSDTNTEIVSGLNEGDEVVTAVINPNTSTNSTASPFGIRTGGFGGGNATFRRGG